MLRDWSSVRTIRTVQEIQLLLTSIRIGRSSSIHVWAIGFQHPMPYASCVEYLPTIFPKRQLNIGKWSINEQMGKNHIISYSIHIYHSWNDSIAPNGPARAPQFSYANALPVSLWTQLFAHAVWSVKPTVYCCFVGWWLTGIIRC